MPRAEGGHRDSGHVDAAADDSVTQSEAGASTRHVGPPENDPVESSPATTGAATSMRRSQVRGSSLLLVGRILSLVLTTATQVVIVRALSKTDYGAFAYAFALAGSGQMLLSLGQGRLLSRFMSTYDEQRDYGRMFGAMLLSVATIAVTSTLTIAALYLFTDTLIVSIVHDPKAASLVLIMVFIAPLEALDMVFVALFAVFSKARAIFVRKYLLAPGLRLTVVLLLLALNASVTFLAVGYVLAQLVGILIYMTLLVRALRERGLLQHFRLKSLTMPYKAVFGFSVPLLTAELVFLSMNVGGIIQLGFFKSVAEVANYRAVYPAARLNQAVWAVFVTLFLPMAARLFARNDIDGLRRNYWHTAVFVAVLTFPIFALTGPLAPDTAVLLFGAKYAESSTTLSLLALGYYFNVAMGFNAFTLQVCGRLRFLVGVNITVAILNIGLGFVLVPQLGAAGVALANLITLVTQNLLNQWALRRAIRTSWIDYKYVRCYLIIFGSGGALWAFQLLIRPNFVVAVGAALVASAVVMLGSRSAMELSTTFPELQRVPIVRWLVR